MSKQKSPDLADWEVTVHHPSGVYHKTTVRASRHEIRDGSVILSSASGHALFSAPAACTIARRVSDWDREARRAAAAEQPAAGTEGKPEFVPDAVQPPRGPKTPAASRRKATAK